MTDAELNAFAPCPFCGHKMSVKDNIFLCDPCGMRVEIPRSNFDHLSHDKQRIFLKEAWNYLAKQIEDSKND